MDGLRNWCGNLLEGLLQDLSILWAWFVHGLMYDFSVSYFIFALGAVTLVGFLYLWRRHI